MLLRGAASGVLVRTFAIDGRVLGGMQFGESCAGAVWGVG